MDFIEINKLTQFKKVQAASDKLYSNKTIDSYDAVILISYACKKLYGVKNTAKLIHSLGVKDLKI